VRRIIVGLWLIGAARAGTITVNSAGDSFRIFVGPDNQNANGVLSFTPSGNISTGSVWSLTGSVLTNMVDAGGGTATADGTLRIQFTGVTLTCVQTGGCDQTGGNNLAFGFNASFVVLNPAAVPSYGYSLSGSGPDVTMALEDNEHHLSSITQPILGPTYSFSRSGSLPPSWNGSIQFLAEFLLDGSYAQGTTLSLPSSFDLTLTNPNSVPEPATIALLAAGIGLAAWRLRQGHRRTSQSRR
jgi:hypothetical protein